MTIDPRMARRRSAVAEQRARANIRRLVLLLLVAGLAATVIWLFRSPLLSVDHVRVDGVVASSVQADLVTAGVVEGVPLISIDPSGVESRLEEDPRVVVARVEREWPDTIVVTITERFPIAWIADGGTGFAHVALDGTVVETGTPPEGGPVILISGSVPLEPGARIEGREILGAIEFIDALRSDLRRGIVVDVTGEELTAEVGTYRIRLGLPSDMAAKGRVLAAVVDEHPEEGSEITLVSPERPAVLEPSATTIPDEGGSDGSEAP